jgi:hypothetical protein
MLAGVFKRCPSKCIENFKWSPRPKCVIESNLFLLMKMKNEKNYIIACAILITLLHSEIGLKK